MALVTRLRAIHKQPSVNDITTNLTSLQFESALSEEEKKHMILRARHHAIAVTHCALATVVVDVFVRARKALLDFVKQDNQGPTNIIHAEEDKDSLIVGIIGCGRLGRQIAHCLLTYGQLPPNRLKISTRRPETLGDLLRNGVECYFSNKRLISSVHVVIVCVLPSQMSCVAEEIRDSISSSHLIICHMSSLSARRLCQMLHSTNIICPVLHRSSDSTETINYNHSLDVNTALENRETVLGTCPIGVEKAVVSTDHRLAETIILSVVNMCTEQGLSQEQTLTIVHTAVFGGSRKKPPTCDRLAPEHFGVAETMQDKDKCFPFYNLVDSFENGTPLLKVLLENESMQKTFVSRYCHLFEDYIHKRTYGHI